MNSTTNSTKFNFAANNTPFVIGNQPFQFGSSNVAREIQPFVALQPVSGFYAKKELKSGKQTQLKSVSPIKARLCQEYRFAPYKKTESKTKIILRNPNYIATKFGKDPSKSSESSMKLTKTDEIANKNEKPTKMEKSTQTDMDMEVTQKSEKMKISFILNQEIKNEKEKEKDAIQSLIKLKSNKKKQYAFENKRIQRKASVIRSINSLKRNCFYCDVDDNYAQKKKQIKNSIYNIIANKNKTEIELAIEELKVFLTENSETRNVLPELIKILFDYSKKLV